MIVPLAIRRLDHAPHHPGHATTPRKHLAEREPRPRRSPSSGNFHRAAGEGAMEVGVGLPAGVPGAPGDLVLDWARRADSGPFSSLGVIDRVAYDNYDPFLSLAAAAAVTSRLRLVTMVVIGPLRNQAMLAKQAASLDALSGGRLTLGVAIG